MATVTRTQTVTADAWFVTDGSTNYGNGKGARMGVGDSGNWVSPAWQDRFAVRIPRGTLFDGIPSKDAITAFDIKLRAVNSCYGIGGAVKFFLERATASFAENSYAVDCGASTAGTVGVGRWPGPARTATDRGSYAGSPSGGDWITVGLLNLGKWWYDHPEIANLDLVGIAANAGLTDYEETTSARRCVFYTHETTSAPYAQLQYNDESPPDAPSNLSPADGATVASTNSTQATVQGTYTQAQGLSSTKYEAAWYPASATDATPGTPTVDNVVTATTASGAVRTHTFSGLPARTAGKWRMRFERNGVWGPWSLMRAATTAYQPGTPSQPSVTPATLTPDFFASIVSSDSADYITKAEVNVYQDPAQGQTITKWASGEVTIGGSPTRLQLAYGGTALVYGTQYRWVVRLANRDGVWSAFTGNLYFTQLEAVGPNISPGDTGTKQNSRTPTFTLTDPGSANIDQIRVRYYSPSGTLLHDTGVLNKTSGASQTDAPPSGIWDWGQEPLIDAAIRLTGNANLGPFCAQRRVHINAQPGAPSPVAVVNTTDAVQRSDGVWVVPTDAPTLRFPFVDSDKDLGYTEAPTRREIELRNLADAHVGASPYVITSGITDDWQIPAGVLVAETTYKARARYDDNASVRSVFSTYMQVKRSARPTLSAVTPANAATVTDPTPTIAWTYAHSGGLAQRAYRITATVDGNVIYDSDWLVSAAASHVIPANVLPNGKTVSWTLDVENTDGLRATQIARTFTTSFTQPPTLTGLVLTPDPDSLTVTVAWTASGLSDDEFVEYDIDARSGAGQFRRVARITAKATTSYVYRAAGHNVETIIRLSQSNGWLESVPVEASTELTVDGTWRIGPDGAATQLRFNEWPSHAHPRATETAEYAPPGARFKRVVTIGSWGVDGRLRLRVPPADQDVVALLQDDAATGRIVLLKTGRGLAVYAKLREVTPTDAASGWTNVDLAYTEIAPAEAGF